MSILDHPEAKALLADAVVSPEAVGERLGRWDEFLGRYLPRFYRAEQRRTAALVLRGRLGGLERKTCEPIAIEADVPRKPVQFFVGAGKWDDEAVMAELRAHVVEELGDPGAVVVVDGSGFAKKGVESCGVSRQWCGRLGKVENCQVGVFLAYAAAAGSAPLDRRLYLPEDWALDPDRRAKCHVPPGIAFQEKWRIALDLLDRGLPGLPHGWVADDDEFGRASEFRAALRTRGERYVVDVPGDTTVRDLERRPPPKRPGKRRRRATPFLRAAWAARRPAARWERIAVGDGEKGPLEVEAVWTRVRTKDVDRRIGPEERLIAIRGVGEARVDYALTNAGPEAALAEVVRAQRKRHRIEEVFEAAKGEVGLAHYEVRSWVGWHHHMTLSFVALWFLCLERRRIGGENPGGDLAPSPPDPDAPAAARPAGDRRRNDPGRQPRPAAQRGGADLPLAQIRPTIPPRPTPPANDSTRGEQSSIRLNGYSRTERPPAGSRWVRQSAASPTLGLS
jgi:SRSO17 transposase